jgi:hypothetical protein
MFNSIIWQEAFHTAFYKAVAVTLALVVTFLILEPMVSHGAASASSTFIITQDITGEISFLTPGSATVMVGSIAGVTGGEATGTTQVVVRSSSGTGYAMDISFSNNPAMRGNTTLSTALKNYAYSSSSEPTFIFNSTSTGGTAQFAYTVNASSTADLDASFLNNGSACNTGGSSTFGRCWMAPSTSDFRIISASSTPPTSGSTTTITFRVAVPSNPSPLLPSDTYTATATLTATNQ